MSGAHATSRRGSVRRSRRGPGVMGVVGLLLLLALLAALGWAAWQYLWTNVSSHRAAGRATASLQQQWSQKAGSKTATTPGDGQPIAELRIPDLGKDWQYPVVVGTSSASLATGVGWYPSSAKPGQVGNFALTGHRVTHGEPFRNLPRLPKGAQVIVETRDAVYTYVLDNAPSQLTVSRDAGWVLEPVPGRPAQAPTRALITLTTSQDLLPTGDRSVAFGHLMATHKK